MDDVIDTSLSVEDQSCTPISSPTGGSTFHAVHSILIDYIDFRYIT